MALRGAGAACGYRSPIDRTLRTREQICKGASRTHAGPPAYSAQSFLHRFCCASIVAPAGKGVDIEANDGTKTTDSGEIAAGRTDGCVAAQASPALMEKQAWT
jgi:hypothetical protein